MIRPESMNNRELEIRIVELVHEWDDVQTKLHQYDTTADLRRIGREIDIVRNLLRRRRSV